MSYDDDRHERRSKVWKHFTAKDHIYATCHVCRSDYSYRTSISNLWKHYKKHHAHLESEESNNDEQDTFPKDLSHSMKKYYRSTERPNVVHCRLCDEDVVGSTVEELARHVRDTHDLGSGSDSDDEADETNTKGPLWSFFKRHQKTQLATCKLCKCAISYRSGEYYLKRHIKIKHPSVRLLDQEDDPKTIIISANGQLYEVDNEPRDNDSQSDPIDMDTVYLDEFADVDDSIKKFTKKGRENSPTRTKVCRPAKRKFYHDTGSEDERSKIVSSENKEMDSLDCFGKYLISLMKGLPKAISDRLQSEMIKLAIDAKIGYEAQKEMDYKITVLNNSAEEPVTVTVSETTGSADGEIPTMTD